MTAGIHRKYVAVQVRSLWRPGTSGMILTFGDEPLTNTVSTLCPRCFATTPRRLLLGRAVLNVQVTIEQLGDFASGAWFPNLVQCSQNVLAETTIRIRNLLHRWFHRLEELTQLSPAMCASAAGQGEPVW
jgi:hypothetical protein